MKHLLRGLAAGLALLHASAGWGQSLEKSGKDPQPPQKRTPASDPDLAGAFASPFADYRRFEPEPQLLDWRAANEEVKNAGGHIGLMRALRGNQEPPRAEQGGARPPTKGHH